MGDKDTRFTFGRPELPEDRDPTVRDVHRLELEQTSDEAKPVAGFNPYNRDVPGKAKTQTPDPAPTGVNRTSTTTRTDLRKLSEWIKLRQQVDALKSSEAGKPDEAERVPTVRIPRPKF